MRANFEKRPFENEKSFMDGIDVLLASFCSFGAKLDFSASLSLVLPYHSNYIELSVRNLLETTTIPHHLPLLLETCIIDFSNGIEEWAKRAKEVIAGIVLQDRGVTVS